MALAGTLLAGCSDGSEAPEESSLPGEGASRGGKQAAPLTEAQLHRVDSAEQRLIRACMKKAGYRYWISDSLTTDERRSVGYVLDDVDWAREHGYGGRIQRKVEKERAEDPNIAYTAQLSPSRRQGYDRALAGGQRSSDDLTAELPGGGEVARPSRGCMAQAQHELYGDLPTWFRVSTIADNLTTLYVDRLKRDARFTGAVGRWADCMKERGHDYRSPDRLRAQLPDLTEGLDAKKAHRVEVRLAVDEAQCADSSTLGRTARELERRYRAKAVDDRYSDEIRRHRRMQQAAVHNARALTNNERQTADG
ncbi:hypothetical protein MTQ01_09305 [Streptomyces sp. XM4193]|nr:hypothetical protein [Streptomyces sp. XM4193]